MLDEEKAGFVRAFLIELANTARSLYPDTDLTQQDTAFINNPIERDEDGTLKVFIENHLIVKRNANCAELDGIYGNIKQLLDCLALKHHLVEPYMTYEHATLLDFYSDGLQRGYGDFYLSQYLTVKFKEY